MYAAALHNVHSTIVAMLVYINQIGCHGEAVHVCVSKQQCSKVKKVVRILTDCVYSIHLHMT